MLAEARERRDEARTCIDGGCSRDAHVDVPRGHLDAFASCPGFNRCALRLGAKVLVLS